MARPLDNVNMKHLSWLSYFVLLLGIAWIIVAWLFVSDRIWITPGVFLIVSGIVKIVAVNVMTRVAKLGTDDHKPIRAL